MATREDAAAYLRSIGLTDPDVIDYHAQQLVPDAPAAAPAPAPDTFEDWEDSAGRGAVRRSVPWEPQNVEDNVPSGSAQPPTALQRGLERAGAAITSGPVKAVEAAGIVPSVGPERYDDSRYPNFVAKPGEIGPPRAPTELTPEDQWDHSAPAGGTPRMVDPGGWRPHSRAVQEGLDLTNTIRATGMADASSRDAAAAARDAGISQANREVAYLDRHEQLQNERAQRLKWQAEDRQRRYDAEMDKLATLTEAVRKDKIDPGSIFTKSGTSGAFFASIAYMLGAVGGALTHTENPVMGVIREEIQAQKDNAAMRRQRIEDQKGLLGQLARTFGDETVGEEAAWVAYLEKAKTEMQRIVADSQNEWVIAKYKSAVAGIDDELARRIGTIEEKTQDRTARQDVFAPPTYMGGGAKADNADPLFVPTDPHGGGFKARSEKEAQAARGVITAEQNLIPMLEELKQLRKKTGIIERTASRRDVYDSADMARIKSIQAQVSLGLRDLSATSPGAMDKGMQELAGQIQGDWTKPAGNPEAAADAFIASIRRQKDSLMRGQGAQSQKQSLHVDQKGNVVTGLRGQPRFANPKGDKPKSFKGAE